MFDVIVIGAGPVGSRTAFQLAAFGYSVLVLEKKPDLNGQVCCTGIIGQECADALGLESSLVYRQARSAKLYSPSGKEVRVQRPEPQATILNRPAFNAAMASRAQSQGAEYRFNCGVTSVAAGKDGISVQAANGETLDARAVVDAAGFAAKIGGLPDADGVDFIMGAQAEVDTTVDEVEVYFGDETAPGFFAWLAPTAPGKALAGLLSRRRPAYYLKKLLSRLVSQGKIRSADVPLTHGGIPLQPLAKSYGKRLIIAGTAAGQVKPTTGGGIYYGLLCADIAAKHLDRALKTGDLSAASLSRYQREWHKLLGKELRVGYWARKMYEYLNDRQLDHLFDIITATGMDKTLENAADLSFDWHSKVVTRLLGEKAFAKAFMLMKTPFLHGNSHVVYNIKSERE